MDFSAVHGCIVSLASVGSGTDHRRPAYLPRCTQLWSAAGRNQRPAKMAASTSLFRPLSLKLEVRVCENADQGQCYAGEVMNVGFSTEENEVAGNDNTALEMAEDVVCDG